MEEDTRTPTGWHQAGQDAEPAADPASLGVLALSLGALSLLLAMTVYLTLFAVIGAVVAGVLGLLALGDDRSRRLGAGAIAVALVAISVSALVLVSLA